MISLSNVEKKFKSKMVLSNIALDINKSGIYVISGKNGCGKSTLLKLLSGIIYKSDGYLAIDGVVSYLPDKFMMPRLMKVSAYLKLVIEDKSLVNELMSKFLIPNKKISELSKGNLQKLGLLQVLTKNADIFILDEPLDGLDDFAKKLVKDIISDLIKKDKIIIMSLHTKSLFKDMDTFTYEIKEGSINEKKKRTQSHKAD